MSARGPLGPPGGLMPPERATLSDGTVLELRALAAQVSAAHLGRHPEDVERYGPELAEQWCTHDNQHILNWAAGDIDLRGQLAWLARVLGSRGYPVANLIDNVETAADVVAREVGGADGAALAARLRAAAQAIEPAGEASG